MTYELKQKTHTQILSAATYQQQTAILECAAIWWQVKTFLTEQVKDYIFLNVVCPQSWYASKN